MFNKIIDLGKVLCMGVGMIKFVEVKFDIGFEKGEFVSCGSKILFLRRLVIG